MEQYYPKKRWPETFLPKPTMDPGAARWRTFAREAKPHEQSDQLDQPNEPLNDFELIHPPPPEPICNPPRERFSRPKSNYRLDDHTAAFRLKVMPTSTHCFCRKQASLTFTAEFGWIYECAYMKTTSTTEIASSTMQRRSLICGFHLHKRAWDLFRDRLYDKKEFNPSDIELSVCPLFNLTFCIIFGVTNQYHKRTVMTPTCFCNANVVLYEEKLRNKSNFLLTCPNFFIDGARPKCSWSLHANRVPFKKTDRPTHYLPYSNVEGEDVDEPSSTNSSQLSSINLHTTDTVVTENIFENSIREDTIREDAFEDNVQENIIQEDIIQEDTIQEDTIQEDNVQKDNVQEDNVQKDNVQEDNVQEDTIQENNVIENTIQEPVEMTDTVIDNIFRRYITTEDNIVKDHSTNDTPKEYIDIKYASGSMTAEDVTSKNAPEIHNTTRKVVPEDFLIGNPTSQSITETPALNTVLINKTSEEYPSMEKNNLQSLIDLEDNFSNNLFTGSPHYASKDEPPISTYNSTFYPVSMPVNTSSILPFSLPPVTKDLPISYLSSLSKPISTESQIQSLLTTINNYSTPVSIFDTHSYGTNCQSTSTLLYKQHSPTQAEIKLEEHRQKHKELSEQLKVLQLEREEEIERRIVAESSVEKLRIDIDILRNQIQQSIVQNNTERMQLLQSADEQEKLIEEEIELRQNCQRRLTALEGHYSDLEANYFTVVREREIQKERSVTKDLKCLICYEKPMEYLLVPCFHFGKLFFIYI
ncbi:hypothetical protein BDF14DRAFT_1887222 [Spinellus fusiger]|nr:hypothetical protein BDF14DRAFT_1887222 [Spinellus fusiger]